MSAHDLHRPARATVALGGVAVVGAISMSLAIPADVPAPVVVAAWTAFGLFLAMMAWFGIIAPLCAELDHERRSRLREETRTAAEKRRRQLVTLIEKAADGAQSEPELVELVARTMSEVLGDRDNSILLSRGDGRHVAWSLPVGADGMGIPVELEPQPRCVALTRGHTTMSEASTDIGGCPHSSGEPVAVSTVCVPIPLDEGFIGVATSAGAPGDLPHPDDVETVELVCRSAGTRIAALRHRRAERVEGARRDVGALLDHHDALGIAEAAIESGGECSIALCDIDGFSGYNDRHGAAAGDRALDFYVDVVDATLRPTDVISRFGGDRFVCVLSSCSAGQAVSALERVREALVLSFATSDIASFSLSVGIADRRAGHDVASIIEAADVALAVAKQAGGNRVQGTQFTDATFGDTD